MRVSRRATEDSLPLLQNVKIMTASNGETPSGIYNPSNNLSTQESEKIDGRFCLIRLILIYDFFLFLIPRPFLKDSNLMTFRLQFGVIKYKATYLKYIDMICFFLSLVALTTAVLASMRAFWFCTTEVCNTSPFDYFVTLHDDNTLFTARPNLTHTDSTSTSNRRLLSISNDNNHSNVTYNSSQTETYNNDAMDSFYDMVNQNLSRAIDLLKESVQGYCNQSNTTKVAIISREWNNITYDGIHFHQEAPSYLSDFTVSHWMPSGYYPWLILYFIFSVSIFFQFYRWRQNNVIGNDRVSPIDIAKLFKVIFFQSTTFADCIPYDQKKPDFWRWVEYAATSPFQILLIANSVLITDRGKLLGLMGAQAALVMLGCINEHILDKCFKKMIKAWKQKKQDNQKLEWPEMAGNNFLKIRILLIVSWLVFVSIWWSILSAFERQERNTYTCNYKERMPAAIWFIIGTQFGFFALFGCVQTVQYFQLLYLEMDMLTYAETREDLWWDDTTDKLITQEQENEIEGKEIRQEIPKASRDNMQGMKNKDNSVLLFLNRRRQQSWQNTALAYSMLSVLAKTTLEFGFIWFVLFSSNANVPTTK